MTYPTSPHQPLTIGVDEASLPQLPPHVLAQVLKHVDTPERLRDCARVCTTWHTAAVLATSQITAVHLTASKAWAVSDWLKKYGHTAAIRGIRLQADSTAFVTVSLPFGWLDQLEVLELDGLQVFGASAIGGKHFEASFMGLQGLQGPNPPTLGRLKITDCTLMLPKLMPLGTLQQLVLDGNSFDSYMNSKTDILGESAQHLEQLTYLCLGGLYTQDTVMRNVRHVSHLQQLVLRDSVSTAGGLDALPAPLTSLEVSLMSGRQYEHLFITQRPRAVFSASDTPGLLQLTGLQHLKISNADAVHASVLSALCSLTHLDVSQLSLAGDLDQGGPGVSALTTLTNLQHLHVRSVAQGSIQVAVTAADINALTSSSHLTYLGLGAGVVSEQDYLGLFLPGRKLPALKELTATMQLLSHPDTMEALAAACEGLQTLKLIDSVEGEPIEGWLDEEDGSERYSWLPLQSLSALTALHLELKGHDVSQAAWECLSGVSQPKYLDLGSVSLRSFPGVMQLAGLTGLEQLRFVAGGNKLAWLKAEFAAPTEVALPAIALEQAIQVFDDQQEDGAGSNSAMVCLVRAAAAQVRIVYARQYQQQQLHTKEVAELRAQLQQQQLLQEQQLADLRIQQEEQRLVKRKLAVLHAKQQQQQVLSQELHELRTKQHQVEAMQQRLAALEQQMQALLLQQQAKQQ